MRNLVEKIIQRWFLSEPPLFRAVCLFTLKENCNMACPVRIGARDKAFSIGMESLEISSKEKGLRRLEYNPELLRQMSEQEIGEHFKCEMIRVLLKHPYERIPEGCSLEAAALGSNILIGENYISHYLDIPRAKDWALEENHVYEWYSLRIQELMQEHKGIPGKEGDSQPDTSSLSDLSEQWEEDQFMAETVNTVIRECEELNEWGSMSGNLIEKIVSGVKAKINWKTVLSGFRASILSSKRKLTRMRPSRRFGFDQMGSMREFDTRVLIGMDVSGSVSSRCIEYFLGVVNSSFRYGIKQIDLVQFDAGITTVMTLKKALKSMAAVGRGGTDFQPVIDYAVRNRYDGLVILTDGFADEPVIPHNATLKIAWVCADKRSYSANSLWMKKTGRVCLMNII